MFRKLIIAGAMALSGAAALAPAADAQRYYGAPTYGYGYGDRSGYDRGYYDRAGYDRGYDNRGYDGRGYDTRYRGDDRGYYRPRGCSNGTTGTIIGAIAGGLLGRTIDTRGDRTLGTVLGGAGGAILGHEIERSGNNGYCR